MARGRLSGIRSFVRDFTLTPPYRAQSAFFPVSRPLRLVCCAGSSCSVPFRFARFCLVRVLSVSHPVPTGVRSGSCLDSSVSSPLFLGCTSSSRSCLVRVLYVQLEIRSVSFSGFCLTLSATDAYLLTLPSRKLVLAFRMPDRPLRLCVPDTFQGLRGLLGKLVAQKATARLRFSFFAHTVAFIAIGRSGNSEGRPKRGCSCKKSNCTAQFPFFAHAVAFVAIGRPGNSYSRTGRGCSCANSQNRRVIVVQTRHTGETRRNLAKPTQTCLKTLIQFKSGYGSEPLRQGREPARPS